MIVNRSWQLVSPLMSLQIHVVHTSQLYTKHSASLLIYTRSVVDKFPTSDAKVHPGFSDKPCCLMYFAYILHPVRQELSFNCMCLRTIYCNARDYTEHDVTTHIDSRLRCSHALTKLSESQTDQIQTMRNHISSRKMGF